MIATFSQRLRRHWSLTIILALYLVAGGFYAIIAPFLDVSDEVRHYAMVERLARGGGLTVQDPILNAQIVAEERLAQRPLTYEAQEGSQPPLYYALMALVALPFDRSDWEEMVWPNPHAMLGRADTTNNWNQLQHTPASNFPWQRTTLAAMVMRFIGVMFGAVVVACAYFIAMELGGGRRVEGGGWIDSSLSTLHSPLLPALAASLVAFNPMFVHIMASVNNDTLAAAASSLALLLGARMIVRGATLKQCLLLGIVLGVAALTKASGLALAGVVPFFVLIAEFLKVRKWESGKVGSASPTFSLSHFLTFSAAMLLPMLLIAGWWYVRNQVLYGDLTGTTMMAQIAGPRERIPTPLELVGEWDGFFKAYWGLFGAVNIPMHEPIYIALEVMTALAGVGLVLLVIDAISEGEKVRKWESGKVRNPHLNFSPSPLLPFSLSHLLILAMLFSALAVAFIALVRWTSITLASQGRLLFPVIVPISIFTALGLLRALMAFASLIKRPLAQWVAPALLVALAALTLLSPFVYIAPAYALPAKLQNETQLPANTQFTQLYFEDKMRWIGFVVNTPAQRVRPGDVLDVTLYWQALKPMDRNYSAFIRVLGRDDAQVHVLNTYPGGGMWQTTLWQQGAVIADRYRLRINDTLTNTQLMPTMLKLDVGFWDFTTKEFLKTFDGQGKPTGRQTYEAASMAVQTPLSANAAIEKQRLEKARVANVSAAYAGKRITLALDWLVDADFERDYTTFVQLFDYTGKKLDPQADGRALNGAFPSRWWRKGDVVRGDQYVIDLPQPLPAGKYLIKFGLYDKDNQRMPAFDGDQPINDAGISVPLSIE